MPSQFRSDQARPGHVGGTLTLACGAIGAHSEYARGTPGDVLQRFGIPGDHDTEKILGKSTWSSLEQDIHWSSLSWA